MDVAREQHNVDWMRRELQRLLAEYDNAIGDRELIRVVTAQLKLARYGFTPHRARAILKGGE